MMKFTHDESLRLLRGLRALDQEHRDALADADKRAADTKYEYRCEALKAASEHAHEISRISVLVAKVWRLASEAQRES